MINRISAMNGEYSVSGRAMVKDKMYRMLVAGRTAKLGSVLDGCDGCDLCMLSGWGCERRLGVMG